METTSPRLTELDPGDFDRLGVQPQECRLTVIRRAAARAALMVAQANARRAANQPYDSTEASQGFTQELSLVAASAYRLLDPRRRADPTERAHVGRILPGALIAAGHTKFHSTPFAHGEFDTTEDDIAAPVLIGDTAITETVPHHEPWSTVLSRNAAELGEQICTRELIRHYESMLPLERVRRWMHQPQMIVGLTAALLLTSVWLVFWRQQETSRVRNSRLIQQPQPNPSAAPASPVAVPSSASSAATLPATLPADTTPSPSQRSIETLEPELPSPALPSIQEPAIPELHTVRSPRPRADWTLLIQRNVSPSNPESLSTPLIEIVPAKPKSRASERVPAFSADESKETRNRLLGELLILDYLETLEDITALQVAADRFLQSSSDGSLDQWSAEIIAATSAWFSGDIGELHRRWQTNSERYDVNFAQFIVMTYTEAVSLPCSIELNAFVISHGLEAVQLILADDTLDACEELIGLSQIQRDNVQAWENLSDAIRQAKRTRTRVVDRGPIDEASPSEATLIGRHLCFISRQWNEGLPWLARCGDARLAGIAKNDLLLAASTSNEVNDWVEASKSWQVYSERLTGYSQQVVQLHAVELLSQAVSHASPIEELRLTEELEQLQSQIPKALVIANDWAKRLDREQDNESVDQTTLAPDPSEAMLKPEPLLIEPVYLSGRVCTAVGAEEVLSLRYQAGTVIGPENLAMLYRSLGWRLSPLCIDVSGTFSAIEEGTVIVRTQVSSRKIRQTVYIDDEQIEIDPLQGMARCSVNQGEHIVRWVVEGVNFESLFLSLDR